MTKLVIFDMDGVLINSNIYHFEALNKVLDQNYLISLEEHENIYDGLSTKQKLNILSNKKGLPIEKHADISINKQIETINIMKSKISKDYELIEYFKKLVSLDFKIAIASNSIRNTVKIVLLRLGILEYVDIYLSNEDVIRKKPYPEIYWKCMIAMGSIPETTVIVEDSKIGIKAALNSQCHLITVTNRKDLSQIKINEIIDKLNLKEKKSYIHESKSLNVLIPMAGNGSRFAAKGFTFPKPLIEVRKKPMIQLVVENINLDANFIFVVKEDEYKKYNLNYLLPLIAPNCKIVMVKNTTQGAACTTLLAKELIDNDSSLLLANSDQFLEWNSSNMLESFDSDDLDGGIVTFPAKHPKWSYAKINNDNLITEVAEKKPISEHATVGVYYWKKGSDYVKYANQMIKKNIRVNNEFYVCPVFNEAIQDNKKFKIYELPKDSMWGIGTPEDLQYFLENYKGNI